MKEPPTRRAAGFSLIEVTLALGIIAFAFLAVFGLLPVGLDTFRRSMDRTEAAQIAQRLVAEAQQTPFDNVPSLFGKLYYFDSEGERLTAADAKSTSGPAGYVYSAVIDAATDTVANNNVTGVGISTTRTRLIVIKIAKNRLVTKLAAGEAPLAQSPFAIADVKL